MVTKAWGLGYSHEAQEEQKGKGWQSVEHSATTRALAMWSVAFKTGGLYSSRGQPEPSAPGKKLIHVDTTYIHLHLQMVIAVLFSSCHAWTTEKTHLI